MTEDIDTLSRDDLKKEVLQLRELNMLQGKAIAKLLNKRETR